MFLAWLGLAEAADPFALPAKVVTLDNGLVVLLLEDHRTDTVALHLSYGVGSRDERPGEFGCAHLFEHLMFEGSKSVPVNAFDQWLEGAGGENNAFTSEDRTDYHETFPSGALDLVLFLESDRMGFLDAGLVAENLANQQKVVLQERAEGYAEPNGRDPDLLSWLVWPDAHPYEHPTIGTVADIEGFTLDGVRSFWERHYRPRNAVLALVGNFDAAEAEAKVRHWFSDVPDRGPAEPRGGETPPDPRPGRRGLVEDAVEERAAWLVWQTVPAGHLDEPALELLASVLSGGQGTRLDDELYYGSKDASSIAAWTNHGEVAGTFVVVASTPDTPLEELVASIGEQIEEVYTKAPTEAEVDRAKRALRGRILDELESPEGRAYRLATCWKQYGVADCVADDWKRYDAVRPETLRVVAERWLRVAPSTLSSVPIGGAVDALPGAATVELP